MARKLTCTAPKTLAWQNAALPALAGDAVRVKPEFAAAKHGTEMAIYKGAVNARGHIDGEYNLWLPGCEGWSSFPVDMGNMAVGRVVETGPDCKTLRAGDRVAFYHHFQDECVTGEGWALKMPESMSWKTAVCYDPAQFALTAVRDGHVRPGDAVAVFGLGAIGLMVLQIARLAGADPIIGVDPLPIRRETAKKLGFTDLLDPFACDAGLEIKKATSKRGADVIIDYSGDTKAMQDALRGVAYGGNVVAGAMPSPYVAGLDFGAESHFNIPNIIFTRACSAPDRDHPRWDFGRVCRTVWKMLCEGKLTGEPIVDPVVPFADLLPWYHKIYTNPEQLVKLGTKF